MKELISNADESKSRAVIQNWVDLLVEFGVIKAGMAALLMVCMKSIRPTARNETPRKRARLSLDWL
jgi:hypothetical protein